MTPFSTYRQGLELHQEYEVATGLIDYLELLINDGYMSFRTIAREMNYRCYLDHKGRKWTPMSVKAAKRRLDSFGTAAMPETLGPLLGPNPLPKRIRAKRNRRKPTVGIQWMMRGGF